MAVLAMLAACAGQRARQTQTLQVQVESDDPAWTVPLECEASNDAGHWTFVAPGPVAVIPTKSPLMITCKDPEGAVVEPLTEAPSEVKVTREERKEGYQEGSKTGAKLGVGAGVVLGAASAPVMGPAFAVLIAVGSTLRGAEIGGAVGAIATGAEPSYPSPIVLHIIRLRPCDE